MVMVTSAILPIHDGTLGLEQWLQDITASYSPAEVAAIRDACILVQHDFADLQTPFKLNSLHQGVEIANLLLNLGLDSESLIAAIFYPIVQYSELTLEDLEEQTSPAVCKLLKGSLQMDSFGEFQSHDFASKQIDNFRRMLLAMVDDTRVVLLKLAERTVVMRHLDQLPPVEQNYISRRVMEVFAPLANRLGILELKWELEDLSFHYLQPTEYKQIAKNLNQRRIDREKFIVEFKTQLNERLLKVGIHAEIYGRAKHIYSIYYKMQQKSIPYENISDAIALRIIVNSIEECYQALSVVHTQWQHLTKEFIDYIATPKANGYRSIHTVILVNDRKVEVQIRTQKMHHENELGRAAHWAYKEGERQGAYQNKIAWLRQLLDWQKEMAAGTKMPEQIAQGLIENCIYVFTPEGAVISLPLGSTPLDFAYQIHTEIGHKCRGAKVNDKIVPLTHQLKLGDRVDILTGKEANPSRDWLNPHLGYVTSSRAKTKIHSWFKKRDYDKNLTEGQTILQREIKRLNLTNIDPNELAARFHLQNGIEVLAALGSGDIRAPQLTGALQEFIKKATPVISRETIAKTKRLSTNAILVSGIDDILSSLAPCCKPLPGEPIIGFITVGRGVTVHRSECQNILQAKQQHPERIIEVSWNADTGQQNYAVDLVLEAINRPNLLRDLTKLLSEKTINIIGVNSHVDNETNHAIISICLELNGQAQLQEIQQHLHQVSNIISIRRQ